jgi:deoxyribonuclease (pyrimidine dimer)|tara:strand:+ start:2265 stop:2672 length:408 start_codon:yes stop_codon:yes gene_type:complete
MTRINLVDPGDLSDQHLVAEYREIFMVGPALQRSLKSKNGLTDIPKEFTLNKGHVKFFYNKGKYLHKRYKELIAEMKRRGMKPDPTRKFKTEQWPNELYKDWTPKDQDITIIRERIQQRINQKPYWYRWSQHGIT